MFFLSFLVPMSTDYWDQEHRCVFKDTLMIQLIILYRDTDMSAGKSWT